MPTCAGIFHANFSFIYTSHYLCVFARLCVRLCIRKPYTLFRAGAPPDRPPLNFFQVCQPNAWEKRNGRIVTHTRRPLNFFQVCQPNAWEKEVVAHVHSTHTISSLSTPPSHPFPRHPLIPSIEPQRPTHPLLPETRHEPKRRLRCPEQSSIATTTL